MLCSRRKRYYRNRRKVVDPMGYIVLHSQAYAKFAENSSTESFLMTVDVM